MAILFRTRADQYWHYFTHRMFIDKPDVTSDRPYLRQKSHQSSNNGAEKSTISECRARSADEGRRTWRTTSSGVWGGAVGAVGSRGGDQGYEVCTGQAGSVAGMYDDGFVAEEVGRPWLGWEVKIGVPAITLLAFGCQDRSRVPGRRRVLTWRSNWRR